MRVLSLDFAPLFGDEQDTFSSFGSDTSAFDYDVVIWDPQASLRGYLVYPDEYRGLPSLRDAESARIQADVRRRKAEFLEFVHSGRALVVIARPPQSCYVATGGTRVSGTGRNATSTRMVAEFDITSALPVDGVAMQRATGNRIETIGDGPLQSLLRKYKSHLRYTATIAKAPGSAIAKVQGTDRVISSVIRTEGGGILALLPTPEFTPNSHKDSPDETWPEEAIDFQTELLEALGTLGGDSELSRPGWASEYGTPLQRAMREKVTRQRAVVERARARLSKLRAEADAAELRDQLYLGTGRILELRVKQVLEQLGCVVTEPEPGRDDWRVDFDGAPAVVEIKGVTKSAAEKHAAQLEKWVAGALEESGVAPKGLLIVNTWRETPLEERTEADFPDQMLPYCEGRQHCLVTGLDIFVIACEIDAGPEKAAHWRDEILKTSGRLRGVPDWRIYILHDATEPADGA